MTTADQIRIGKIVGCHGVRGDVKVRPASDDADWAKALREITMQNPKTGETQILQIQSARYQGPLVVIHFKDIDDRNQVEPWVGYHLFAQKTVLPKPDEDEYWVDDLIGLTVVDLETGRARGTVKDLLSSAGSDFLEIQLEDSTQTVVVPFIDKFFPKVNLEEKTVAIDLLTDFLSMATPVTPDRLQQ